MARTVPIDGVSAKPHETCAHVTVCDERRRKRLVKQVQEAQKFQPTAAVASGLAHDFKNIMTTVRLHSDLIGMSMPADAPAQRNLAYIREAATHANQLLDKLAALAMPRRRRASLLRLDKELEQMGELLAAVAGPQVVFERELKACPPVRMDAVEWQQVVLNCVMNAREAMQGAGKISIAAGPVQIGAAAGRSFQPALRSGRYVEIAISDTGRGIKDGALRGCTEPFHTRISKSGWGLGLTIVHSCVARRGGGVKILSHKKEGASVLLALPVAAVREGGTRKKRKSDGIAVGTGSHHLGD